MKYLMLIYFIVVTILILESYFTETADDDFENE